MKTDTVLKAEVCHCGCMGDVLEHAKKSTKRFVVECSDDNKCAIFQITSLSLQLQLLANLLTKSLVSRAGPERAEAMVKGICEEAQGGVELLMTCEDEDYMRTQIEELDALIEFEAGDMPDNASMN